MYHINIISKNKLWKGQVLGLLPLNNMLRQALFSYQYSKGMQGQK